MDPTAAYHQFRVGSTGLNDAPESSITSSSLSSAMQMPTTQNDPPRTERSSSVFGTGSRKAPYGAGDADEGYTLTFESMDAFEAWRAKEEEEKMIEFVRNDRHTSKSVPPRFKEHTKLVCARHSKSGRSKYVKKYPERNRKVPSRKIEGTGCSASISFKTYYETEEVRVCYRAQHSHEIGLANLPFTRRGRRAQVEHEKSRRRRSEVDAEQGRGSTSAPTSTTPAAIPQLEEPELHSLTPEIQEPPPEQTIDPVLFTHDHATQFTSMTTQPVQPVHQMPPTPALPPPQPQQMMAPLPPQPQPTPIPQLTQVHPHNLVQDEQARWDRMSVLFENVRNAARTFEHAPPSVAALETVLVRMYLESPLNGSGHMARSSN